MTPAHDQTPPKTPTRGQACVNETWEQAYRRFETPKEELAKFRKRLRDMGAPQWPKDWWIAELFCGSGAALHALHELGLRNTLGIDLSPSLLAAYNGSSEVMVGDARHLDLPDASFDVAMVHGGLHHLPTLPDDLAQALSEARRILRPGGLFCMVEPWDTPFLRFVHTVMGFRTARRAWNKLDALAVMTEHEADTYFNWLGRPGEILAMLRDRFEPVKQEIGWGKLLWVGRRGEG